MTNNKGTWWFKVANGKYVRAWHHCFLETRRTAARKCDSEFVCPKCNQSYSLVTHLGVKQ